MRNLTMSQDSEAHRQHTTTSRRTTRRTTPQVATPVTALGTLLGASLLKIGWPAWSAIDVLDPPPSAGSSEKTPSRTAQP